MQDHPQSTNFIRPIVPTRQLHSSTQPCHFHPTTLGSATAQRRSAQRPAQDERDIHHPPRTPSIPLPMARLWPLNQLQASHRQTHFPSTRQDQTNSSLGTNSKSRFKHLNSKNRFKHFETEMILFTGSYSQKWRRSANPGCAVSRPLCTW